MKEILFKNGTKMTVPGNLADNIIREYEIRLNISIDGNIGVLHFTDEKDELILFVDPKEIVYIK